MKQRSKYVLGALMMLLFMQFSKAQQFSGNSEKFIDELESFLGKGIDRKQAKEFAANFEKIWPSISESDKQTIYASSNNLVAKGAQANPEYYNYISAIYGFYVKKHPSSAFKQFHETIDAIFNGIDKKKYGAFLKMADGFFNTGIVFENSNFKWRITSKDYMFSYDKTPILTITKGDLCVISTKNDSSHIAGTAGVFRPLLDTWKGNGGRVNWERTGLDKNTTYAELSRYNLNMKTAGFDADSCQMYTIYFEKPLAGRVSDKLVTVSKSVGYTYPKFQSYSKRLFIKDVFKDVDYEGGFALEGASLFGTGDPNQPAQLIVYKGGKKFIKGFSLNYIIKPDKITSQNTRMVVYLDKDSITHSGLDLVYENGDRVFSLIRGSQATTKAPFTNTYHQLDMKFESITWKMGTEELNFGPALARGKELSKATFESSNYFSAVAYQNLMGNSYNHPALSIQNLAKELKTNVLPANEVYTALGGTKDMVLADVYKLAEAGLIDVDQDQELIYVKRKLNDYIAAASKKQDYDVIVFESEMEGNNGNINLLSFDLTLNGVKRVTLSDEQFVKVYPRNETVSIKKNRSFICDGIINSGSVEYFGKNFSFDYQEFKINVVDCDSMRIRVQPLDNVGPQRRLSSVLTGVKGVISIDGKDNKSSVKVKGYEKYPVFECNKETFVFYNKIYQGVYDSTQFYFKNEPFVLDSMDNFVTKSLRFNGEFKSAGIFPVMKESLKVMPDYSLGFVRKAGDAGAKIYADKGIFKNEIRLSGKGLQGDGKISFLTSMAESDAFTFFPDSTNGIAKKYVNTPTTQGMNVPSVKGTDCFVKYAPKDKIFTAKSMDKPLQVYDSLDKVTMKGMVMLRETGMTARGRVYFNNAELSAKRFIFRSRTIDSDTAGFRLKNYDASAIALKTENVKAHVDFDKRYGEFVANGKAEPLIFEEVKYICYMDRFKWYMDREDLTFESDRKSLSIDTDLDLTTPNFFSIHPDQDSLSFMAPKARYDMKNVKITADKVTYLDVADARIVPDSQRVVIRKNANMDEFKNAQIIANSVTKYHSIFNATVKVLARKKYKAEGDYKYIDEDKKESSFHFASITVDTTFQTYAEGEITEDMNFMLSSNFGYKGKITLKAIDIGLNFDGSTRINVNCPGGVLPQWFKFKGVVDPNNIEIPIKDVVESTDGKPLVFGPVLSKDSLMTYPTFFDPIKDKEDFRIVQSTGIMIFDKSVGKYKIGTRENFAETTLPGNIVSLQKEKCLMEGDGKFSFGLNGTDQVIVTPVGTFSQDLKSSVISMDVALNIEFPFIESALEKMAEKINKFPDLAPLETSGSNIIQGFREFSGLKESDRMMEEMLLKGKIKDFSDEIKKSIVLSDVKVERKVVITDKGEEEVWESKGMAGLSNIYKDQVFKKVYVKMRIVKRKSGDFIQFAIYLDPNSPETAYYYFKYDKGILTAYSSDSQFNNAIIETKDDKKKFKGEKGMKDLEIVSASGGAIGFLTE